MKPLLALALASLAAAPAPVATGPGTRYFAGMPPARFQGDAIEVVVFVADVGPYCGQAPAGLVTLACTKAVGGAPVIYLANPCAAGDRDEYARIACHEKGHALGWPGDHPQ